MIQKTYGEAGIPSRAAESAKGITEQEREDDGHDQQEHERLEVAAELQ